MACHLLELKRDILGAQDGSKMALESYLGARQRVKNFNFEIIGLQDSSKIALR